MNECKHGHRPSQDAPECFQCRDQSYKDEIAKLRAEVVTGKTQYECLKIQEEAALKERDSALLQNDDLKGEIVKVKTMCAEWENRTLNPSQVESIWGIGHNALTMHNTNVMCKRCGESVHPDGAHTCKLRPNLGRDLSS